MSEGKQRLLIAYDGSDVANAAVRQAAELFPDRAAVVVTVWEPGLGAMMVSNPGFDVGGSVALAYDPKFLSEVDQAEEHHAAVVSREGARLARSLGLDAEPHAIPDEVHVADAIVDFAAEQDAAAVVIGSHGISGLRSHLRGGTSRHILAHCTRPVVVVRSDEPGKPEAQQG